MVTLSKDASTLFSFTLSPPSSNNVCVCVCRGVNKIFLEDLGSKFLEVAGSLIMACMGEIWTPCNVPFPKVKRCYILGIRMTAGQQELSLI